MTQYNGNIIPPVTSRQFLRNSHISSDLVLRLPKNTNFFDTNNNIYNERIDWSLGDRVRHTNAPVIIGRQPSSPSWATEPTIYDNIIWQPTISNVGVVSQEIHLVWYLWNTYKHTVEIVDKSATGFDNIIWDHDPLDLDELYTRTEYVYNITIYDYGPTVINARLDLTTDVTNHVPDVDYRILGDRAVLLCVEPEWSQRVKERLEWKTSIVSAYDGVERRVAVRQQPRRYFEFVAQISGGQLQKLINQIYMYSNLNFLLPVWTNVTHLKNDAKIGDMTVTLDGTPIIESIKRLVIYQNFDHNTILEPDSISGQVVTLKLPLKASYVKGTKVYPLVFSRINENVSLRSYTSQTKEFNLKFLMEQIAYLPSGPATTFINGIELIDEQPNWREAASGNYINESEILDDNIGRIELIPFGRLTYDRSYTWLLKSYAEITWMYKLLTRLIGRLKIVYVPSWTDDFFMIEDHGVETSYIKVRYNYGTISGIDDQHQFLMIRLRGRPYIIAEVVSLIDNEDDTMRINFKNVISFPFAVSEVLGIHWIKKVRLNNDEIVVDWASAGVAEVDTPFIERKV